MFIHNHRWRLVCTCLQFCHPAEGRRLSWGCIIMSSVVLCWCQYIVVGEDRFVHVWNSADSMQFLCTISLHSTSGFPLAVSQTRNFIATASTIHTAVKVVVIVVVVVVVVVVVAVVVAAAAAAVSLLLLLLWGTFKTFVDGYRWTLWIFWLSVSVYYELFEWPLCNNGSQCLKTL